MYNLCCFVVIIISLLASIMFYLGTSEFCAKKLRDLQILRAIFANSAQILRKNPFFFGRVTEAQKFRKLLYTNYP